MPNYEVHVILDEVHTVEADSADEAVFQAWELVALFGLYRAKFETDEVKQEEKDG